MNDYLTEADNTAQRKYLCKAERNLRKKGEILRDAPDRDIFRLALGGHAEEGQLIRILSYIHDADARFDTLIKINGITPWGAAIVLALHRLADIAAHDRGTRIRYPADAVRLATARTYGTQEFIGALYLDGAHTALHFEVLSVNPGSFTPEISNAVFCMACKKNATTIILTIYRGNNHNAQPKPEEIETAKRLDASGKVIGIDIADVIIFCSQTYYSFAEHDKI